ncbi:hypothetical protein MFIFM68171_10084 [Madurella fahalii]|uniref:Ribonuclease H1 N-terminal domain-containing protein n=1 Tax=Madurella fahalii TaxID=1157608 RepID=A0ABQ0GQ51_9PEZI
MAPKFYAVRVGRSTGIYMSWEETRPLVNGFKGSDHKSFSTREDAEAYLRNNTPPPATDARDCGSNNDEPHEARTTGKSVLRDPLFEPISPRDGRVTSEGKEVAQGDKKGDRKTKKDEERKLPNRRNGACGNSRNKKDRSKQNGDKNVSITVNSVQVAGV